MEAMAYEMKISTSDAFSVESYEKICQPGTSSQCMTDPPTSAINKEAHTSDVLAKIPENFRISSKPDSYIQSKFIYAALVSQI